jgi:hypothetical protein
MSMLFAVLVAFTCGVGVGALAIVIVVRDHVSFQDDD